MGPTRDIPPAVAKLERAGKVPPRAWTGVGNDHQPDGLLTDLSPHREQRLQELARSASRVFHSLRQIPPVYRQFDASDV